MQKLKIIVVMPAYNAAATLDRTIADIPAGIVDEIILVDDDSQDNTVAVAKKLGLTVFYHKKNRGYGGNQKTCYKKALQQGADIVIMLHPDYQYDSTQIGELIRPLIKGKAEIVFGSRIRTKKEALDGGMPYIKYLLNRVFCLIENLILEVNFSEHFSGFRAYSKDVLIKLPIESFSDDFVFDQQLMISAIAYGYNVGEVPVPVRYFHEASSIKLIRGAKFLLQTLFTLFLYILFRLKIYKSQIFQYKTNSERRDIN